MIKWGCWVLALSVAEADLRKDGAANDASCEMLTGGELCRCEELDGNFGEECDDAMTVGPWLDVTFEQGGSYKATVLTEGHSETLGDPRVIDASQVTLSVAWPDADDEPNVGFSFITLSALPGSHNFLRVQFSELDSGTVYMDTEVIHCPYTGIITFAVLIDFFDYEYSYAPPSYIHFARSCTPTVDTCQEETHGTCDFLTHPYGTPGEGGCGLGRCCVENDTCVDKSECYFYYAVYPSLQSIWPDHTPEMGEGNGMVVVMEPEVEEAQAGESMSDGTAPNTFDFDPVNVYIDYPTCGSVTPPTTQFIDLQAEAMVCSWMAPGSNTPDRLNLTSPLHSGQTLEAQLRQRIANVLSVNKNDMEMYHRPSSAASYSGIFYQKATLGTQQQMCAGTLLTVRLDEAYSQADSFPTEILQNQRVSFSFNPPPIDVVEVSIASWSAPPPVPTTEVDDNNNQWDVVKAVLLTAAALCVVAGLALMVKRRWSNRKKVWAGPGLAREAEDFEYDQEGSAEGLAAFQETSDHDEVTRSVWEAISEGLLSKSTDTGTAGGTAGCSETALLPLREKFVAGEVQGWSQFSRVVYPWHIKGLVPSVPSPASLAVDTDCPANARRRKFTTSNRVPLESGDASKPWRCPVDGCTKSYKRKDHVIRHMSSHENVRLTCHWPGCDKRFSLQTNLRRHEKTHDRTRPYLCHTCSKPLTSMHELQKHRQAVHGKITRPPPSPTLGSASSDSSSPSPPAVPSAAVLAPLPLPLSVPTFLPLSSDTAAPPPSSSTTTTTSSSTPALSQNLSWLSSSDALAAAATALNTQWLHSALSAGGGALPPSFPTNTSNMQQQQQLLQMLSMLPLTTSSLPAPRAPSQFSLVPNPISAPLPSQPSSPFSDQSRSGPPSPSPAVEPFLPSLLDLGGGEVEGKSKEVQQWMCDFDDVSSYSSSPISTQSPQRFEPQLFFLDEF